MASHGAPGSQLSVPSRTGSIGQELPKIGDIIHRKNPHASLKDALMKEHGKDWKSMNIEGTVKSIDKGKKWRIEWRIGTHLLAVDHPRSFFKSPKESVPEAGGDLEPGTGAGGEPAGEEEGEGRADRVGEEEEAPDDHGEGNSVDGDLLKCKLGYKVITWKKLLDGVHINASHAVGVMF